MSSDSSNQIVADARVLTADYLPNKMVHRDNERHEIARNLRPLLNDGEPLNMLIHGKPGTGKTAMAKYVVQELKKEKFVKSPYVNCFSQKSRFEIFYELLNKKATVPRDGTSTEKVVEKFDEKVRKNPTIITIDEVDQIADDDILFELSRFKKAGVILIANNPNILAHFDERIRSRFSGLKKIRFKRYTSEELFDILQDRKEYGLYPDSIEKPQLKMIAENSGGDARVAVNSLRLAAQDAENQGAEKITEDIINSSVSDAHDETKLTSLERLNRHQKAVYKVLNEEGKMSMSQIFEEYQTRVDDSKSRRTLRRYLNKMDSYGVVEAEGMNKGRVYSLTE
jgi:orc1/cdc6 family replication initiation protein